MPGLTNSNKKGTQTVNISVGPDPALNGEGQPDHREPPAAQPPAPAVGALGSKYAYDPANGLVDHGVVVDEEFRSLIPPLSAAERSGLEQQLRVDGRALVPLFVWKGHNLLLDGHNRLEICLKWKLPFAVLEIDLPDRDAAKAWILAHQADQRNLSVLSQSWVRGMRRSLVKNRSGGTGANQYTKAQGGSR
jgi:hypothetical protein